MGNGTMAASLTSRDLTDHIGPAEQILYDSNPNAAAAFKLLNFVLLGYLLALLGVVMVSPALAFELLIYGTPCLTCLYASSLWVGRRVLVTDQRLCHRAGPGASWCSWRFADIERVTGIGNSEDRAFALLDQDGQRLWLRRLPNQSDFWQALPTALQDSHNASKEMRFHRIRQDTVVFSLLALPVTLAVAVVLPIVLLWLGTPGPAPHQALFLAAVALAGLALAGLTAFLLGLWAALKQHRARTSRADAEELLAFAADPSIAGRLA
jgi:hypothetical protein